MELNNEAVEKFEEIVQTLVADESRVDIEVYVIDEQVRVDIHLVDVPFAGLELRPSVLEINGGRYVGHPDFADMGEMVDTEEPMYFRDSVITEFDYDVGTIESGCTLAFEC